MTITQGNGRKARRLQFADSEPLTVGVEEEFMLVDASGALAAASGLLLPGHQTERVAAGELKCELQQHAIEIATTPQAANLAGLGESLGELRASARARAAEHGLRVVAAGAHPFTAAREQQVTPLDTFESLAQLHRSILQLERQAISGIHVHVGMPGLNEAVAALDAVAAITPLLIALTGNSPYREGRDSGLASLRAEYLRTNMWGGAPPRISSGDEYRALHERLQAEHDGVQRFLWEVAPVSWLGTLEVRICDAQHELALTQAIAALIQATCALSFEGSAPLARPHEVLERHNRWAVTLYGPDANVLLDGTETRIRAGDAAAALLDNVTAMARQLGTAELLEPLRARCERSAADLQRDVVAANPGPGAMAALVDSLELAD